MRARGALLALALAQLALAPGARAAEMPPSSEPSGYGQALIVSYGALVGGFQGASLLYLLSDGEGVVGGTVLGAPAGWWTTRRLTRERQPSLDSAALISTAGLYGAWTGYQSARLIIRPGAEREEVRVAASGALGNLAGTGLGMLLQGAAPAASTSADLTLAGAFGWQAGAGVGDLAGWAVYEDRRYRSAVELGMGWGLGGGVLGLHRLGAAPPRLSELTLYTAEGIWLGAWTPNLFSDDPLPSHTRGAGRLGAGAGYLTALGLSQLGEPKPARVFVEGLGFSAGSLIGAGVPLLAGAESPDAAWVGPMLASGVAGHAATALLAPAATYTLDEGLMIGGLGVWGGVQAATWSAWADDHPDRFVSSQVQGMGLMLTGVTGAVAMGLPAFTETTPADAAMSLSLGLWGSWLGAWSASLVDPEPDLRPAGLVSGDGALAVGLATTASVWDPSWGQVGVLNGLAVSGATTGALIGIAASGEPRPIRLGTVIGSGVGVAGGLAMALAMPSGDSELSLAPPLPRLRELPFRASFTGGPWVDEDGGDGWQVQVTLLERE